MKQSKYTKELLAPLVQEAYSVVEVLRKLNLKSTGGNYRLIQQRIKAYNLDTSHFTGSVWNKGLTASTHTSIAEANKKNTIPDEEVFTKNSTFSSSKLGPRLRKLGREYRCEICELEMWLNKPISLHVDHIDGDTSNNSLKNLRFLCPNCHQQTDTWGRKNKHGSVVER